VYVVAALFLKRAAELGANVWHTAQVCNITITLMFIPLVLLGGRIPAWHLCWQPAVVALLFMAGQIFTLLSLNEGDVSVATPVLGMKILVVALLSAAIIREGIGPDLWVAAILSSVAIVLLNFSRTQPHQRIGTTILMAALAATAYALMDVLVQKWSPAWGAGRFLPLTMGFVGISSLALHPLVRSRSMLGQTTPFWGGGWVAGGAICLALQGMMIVSFIALYGQATMANVLYSSRGLWSVLAVWLVGHWFANRESKHGPRVLAWRFIGATLLMTAILIVLFSPHGNGKSSPHSHSSNYPYSYS